MPRQYTPTLILRNVLLCKVATKSAVCLSIDMDRDIDIDIVILDIDIDMI